MKNVLIVYASKYGQTKKIAEKMRVWFGEHQIEAKIANVQKISAVSLDKYDGIILGTPLYAGSTDSRLTRWIVDNRTVLASKNTGFYLVCLNAADKRPQARVAEKEILKKLFLETHWTPRFLAVFGGALKYLEYNFFIRFIMKRISKAEGGPTDTSQDYEMTDWSKVRSFVRAFAEGNPHPAFDILTFLEKEPDLAQEIVGVTW